MKLGDNGEAFFVEETEEEYVSSGSLHPLYTLYSGLQDLSQNRNVSSFHGYRGDCYRLKKLFTLG